MKVKNVDFNFKVTAAFRKQFKQAALDADMTNKKFLVHLFELWRRVKGSRTDGYNFER